MIFGAIGEFAIGDVPAADAALVGDNLKYAPWGALGQFAIGQTNDGATQALTASLFVDGDTFYSPTVAATYSLTPALYTDADTFYGHTVTSTYNLSPARFRERPAVAFVKQV